MGDEIKEGREMPGITFITDLTKKTITDTGEIIIGDVDAPVCICGEFLTEMLKKACGYNF